MLRRARGLLLAISLLSAASCRDASGPVPVAEVLLEASFPFVDVGESLQLTGKVVDASGRPLTGREIAWSSSNGQIAVVDRGIVTGRTPGTVTITATAGGRSAQVDVTVEPAVASVTVSSDTVTAVAGKTVSLVPYGSTPNLAEAAVLFVVRDAAGQTLATHSRRFSSSDPSVATIGDSGRVRIVAPGTATISLTAGARSARVQVVAERPYTLRYLGTLGGRESEARNINQAGQVVGRAQDAQGVWQAFLWESGAMRALPSSGPSDAYDINDRGQVAGESGGRAVLWQNGGVVDLHRWGRDTVSSARAVGERGTVAGTASPTGCGRSCVGFGWVLGAGQLTILTSRYPSAINRSDVVAGSEGAGSSSRAFVLQDGQLIHLTDPPTGPARVVIGGVAEDINDLGQVVGAFTVPNSGDAFHAFVWENGVRTDLGTLSGTLSWATGINNRGEVIGWSEYRSSSYRPAVLWRRGRPVRLADLYLDDTWELEYPTAINDRGQIVGRARNRTTGAIGAVLLEPAAP